MKAKIESKVSAPGISSKKNNNGSEEVSNLDQSQKEEKTINETIPSELEIRALADIIYHERLMRGENRSSEDDWFEAENLLTMPLKS